MAGGGAHIARALDLHLCPAFLPLGHTWLTKGLANCESPPFAQRFVPQNTGFLTN